MDTKGEKNRKLPITNMSSQLLACCPQIKVKTERQLAVCFRYSDSEYKNRIIIINNKRIVLYCSPILMLYLRACIYYTNKRKRDGMPVQGICMYVYVYIHTRPPTLCAVHEVRGAAA